jgi:beta-lactamase superfamily II metal-dependent hydrolase
MMNIVTVNVGQGALAIVRHGGEAIIVDSRIPACDDRTVAYVKQVLALSLKDHYVKGLIFTGFDNDHCDVVGASIILRKYRPDWVMYPKYFKKSREASLVFELIREEERLRQSSNQPLNSISNCFRLISKTWIAPTTAASFLSSPDKDHAASHI